MQLVPLATERPSGTPGRLEAPAATRRIQSPAPPTGEATTSSAGSAPLRGGVASWNPQLNNRVATAQQASQFLEGLSLRLQQFKAEAGRAAAAEAGPEAGLQAQRERLDRYWAQRAELSAGSLDSSLAFDADGLAQQRFRVRGIDAQSLRSKGPETLTFSLNSAPWQALSVQVDPGLGVERLAARFDQALAPVGVRAGVDEQGELQFSVDQTGWERVRDRLMVKGDGKRFPTGQFARARAEPEAALIDPGRWPTGTPEEARESLVQVLQSLDRVRQARTEVDRVLAQSGAALDAAPVAATDAAATARYASGFDRLAQQAEFPALSSLANGLQALPRQRVERLLALD